jgi:hypothetical protein
MVTTPEQLAVLLRQGQQMERDSANYLQPPRQGAMHWTQGLAGVLGGVGGNYLQSSAAQQTGEGRMTGEKDLAAGMQGDQQALARALQNPWVGDKARQWQAQAPQREFQQWKMGQAKANAPLERQLLQARIQKARRASAEANSGDPRFGKTGAIFQDPRTGQYYTVQFADDGTRKISPLQDELTPAGLSGRAAADKKQAVMDREFEVKGRQGLSKAASAMDAAERSDANVFRTLDNLERLASPWTTGFKGTLGAYIAGSPASDLAIELDQIKANLGFAELQDMRANSPTGGALGAVSQRELDLLTRAQVALDQAQSLGQFKSALKRIRQIKKEGAAARRRAWERDVKAFGAENVPAPFAQGDEGYQAPQPEPPPTANPRLNFGQQGANPYKQKYGLD